MKSMFKSRNTSGNLRNFQEFEKKKTEYFGLETLSYRSRQLWSLLLENMRQRNSLDQFKGSARQWVCNTHPCRLCKVYPQNVGFL